MNQSTALQQLIKRANDNANPFLPALSQMNQRITRKKPQILTGRVKKVVGTLVRVLIQGVKVGDICELRADDGRLINYGEIIGFDDEEALLSPYGDILGISSSTRVLPTGRAQEVLVSDKLLGRVIDGMGKPIDGKPPLDPLESQPYPIYESAPDPLTRQLIHKPLSLGVRAIDGMLTCGEGQRMGIFAAAGGGKSTLLSSMILGADVDVCVISLIGERGREVREFMEHNLGEEGLKKSVLVIATSDKSSMERARSAYVATAVAEYFRDQGKRVLFLMDSVTRFARALREIGLAAGEPPTRRGFPPSVFATLPKLLERTGMGPTGSITAFYTVLVEGDDMTEPVADETRSILDGHIILSRELAAKNHFPAIDVLASASRVMTNITDKNHLDMVGQVRQMMADYKNAEILIRVGEYKRGSDPQVDRAMENYPRIIQFLRQDMRQITHYDDTINQLKELTR